MLFFTKLKYSLFCFICNHSYQHLYHTLIHTHKDMSISYSNREEMESTCESQSKSVYTAEFMGTALKVHVQVSDRMSMYPGEAEHVVFCSRRTRKCLCSSAHFFWLSWLWDFFLFKPRAVQQIWKSK